MRGGYCFEGWLTEMRDGTGGGGADEEEGRPRKSPNRLEARSAPGGSLEDDEADEKDAGREE